jgi:hypothetical protein
MRIDIDLHVTPRTTRAIKWIALPFAVLAGSAAVAHAWTADTTWISPSKPVSAGSLKALFDEADARLKALETAPSYGSFSTQSDPASGVEVLHPDGPKTFTAPRDGLYKITLSAANKHANTFTNVVTRWHIAGTATRLDSMGLCSATSVPSNDAAAACVTLFRATAGQTVTFQPSYAVTWTGSGHGFYFDYLCERVGS